MTNQKLLFYGSLIGLMSGIDLGITMKLLEFFSGKLVYKLLLNVDFIPIIGNVVWPEFVEFIFHLIVAVFIGVVYVVILQRFSIKSYRNQLLAAIAIAFPTIFLYFPLSLLAIKEVPVVNDIAAFSLWILAHVIYIVSLPIFYRFVTTKHISPA